MPGASLIVIWRQATGWSQDAILIEAAFCPEPSRESPESNLAKAAFLASTRIFKTYRHIPPELHRSPGPWASCAKHGATRPKNGDDANRATAVSSRDGALKRCDSRRPLAEALHLGTTDRTPCRSAKPCRAASKVTSAEFFADKGHEATSQAAGVWLGHLLRTGRPLLSAQTLRKEA
jgi:hypothetical protein